MIMDSEERKTTETTEICPCGNVFHQLDLDDYDSGGSESGRCCPDCGNENFQTIKQLQAELNKHRWIPVSERLPEKTGWYFVYGLDTVTTGRFIVCKKTPNIWVGGADFVDYWKPIILPEGKH